MSAERFAIVTGTSAGIGAAVARQLVANGWHEYVGIIVSVAPLGKSPASPRAAQIPLNIGGAARNASGSRMNGNGATTKMPNRVGVGQKSSEQSAASSSG